MTVATAESGPSLRDTPWNVAALLDPPSPVRAVSAAAGLVVAAGERLHVLRPDSQRLRSLPVPHGAEVRAIAAEPWSPFRFAVATPSTVEMWTCHRPYEPRLTYRPKDPQSRPTHLAWLRRDGEVWLYVRLSNGQIDRLCVRADSVKVETLSCPPAEAIASDARSVLAAMIYEQPDDCWAWVLRPTEKTWDFRWMDWGTTTKELPPYHQHLAVCGGALAASIDWLGHREYTDHCEVSWEQPADENDRSFAMPPGVFWGPLAFGSETVVFAAYQVEGQVNVLRFPRGGEITRIARFGLDDAWQGREATVTGLSWDDCRRALWAASPELGLLRMTEVRP